MRSIDAFIFDIDGVLCSSKKLHEIAVIKALNIYGYNIDESYHRTHLDGLPTRIKLDILNVKQDLRDMITKEKQRLTFELADNYIKFSQEKLDIFKSLKYKHKKIGVCSNAIRDFSELVLDTMKLREFVDILLTNEDVQNPKPNPEIYIKCTKMLNINQSNCIIFEDSRFGLEAAFKSKANVCYIKNPNYLKDGVDKWL